MFKRLTLAMLAVVAIAGCSSVPQAPVAPRPVVTAEPVPLPMPRHKV